MRTSMLAIALLLSLGVWGADQHTTINQVPIKRVSWASGQEMYQEYCVACHGEKADGQGPAAIAYKNKPADLTLLARRNQGKFPYDYFYSVLQFGAVLPTPAHGSSDMPVWLPLFNSLDDNHKAIAEQRMRNLARYVESLQAK